MYRKNCYAVALLSLLACGTAQAHDGFDGVSCGADVSSALIGKRMTNEPVAAIEARHRALGLKDLGGDEISDRLNSVSWQICGKEYMLLTNRRDVVRDVLPIPPHWRRAPEYDGAACLADDKAISATVIAILDNGAVGDAINVPHYSSDDNTLLPAARAWRIDKKAVKFVEITARGLRCPRSGVVTADGGP